MLRYRWLFLFAPFVALGIPDVIEGCGGFFSSSRGAMLQPGQQVFITWDPVKEIESFTVQTKFQGDAMDFGMVLPTPSLPKLHEMPRDFFMGLAAFTVLKTRVQPKSVLLNLGYKKGAAGAGSKAGG